MHCMQSNLYEEKIFEKTSVESASQTIQQIKKQSFVEKVFLWRARNVIETSFNLKSPLIQLIKYFQARM